MQQNRVEQVRKKPRIILDKSFSITGELNVGDIGQALVNGIIESERKDPIGEGGTEWLIKTVRIEKIERIGDKMLRV